MGPYKPIYLIAGIGCLLWNSSTAAPFSIHDELEIREDFSVSWSSLGTDHGTPVPNGTIVSVPDLGGVSVSSGNPAGLTIHSNPGLYTEGVLLSNPGSGAITIEIPVEVQGFGVTIEHLQSVLATYTVSVWGEKIDGGGVVELARSTVESPGSSGNPVFLGIVDPDERIRRVEISASPDNEFVVADPVVQLRQSSSRLKDLPVESQLTFSVSPTATYLRDSLNQTEDTSPSSSAATEGRENALDLQHAFPSLRAGDVLHFERIGISLKGRSVNHVGCVFSADSVIEAGHIQPRVPRAINAGTDIYTPAVGLGSLNVARNISQDFIVGQSNFVPVPIGAMYAFFSLATPGDTSAGVGVRISHIRRDPFLEWLNSYGLVGPKAGLDSDLDGDGLKLIEEFAFLQDPTSSEKNEAGGFAFVPKISSVDPPTPDNPLTILFGAQTEAPLEYIAEFSEDLVNWTPLPSEKIQVLTESDAAKAVFRVVDEGQSFRRFGRISVRYLPSSN